MVLVSVLVNYNKLTTSLKCSHTGPHGYVGLATCVEIICTV